MQTQITYHNITKIVPNRLNPRKYFDEASLNELAESLKQVGMLSPIICRHIKKAAKLEIVCGERRFRAAKIAKLEEIPVIERELTDDEAFDLMITENLQRSDVSPMEEAAAFKSLLEHGKYDIASLAVRFGKSETYIRHRLKLNDLIPEFVKLLNQDIIGIGHAQEICKVTPDHQKEYYGDEFAERGKYWDLPTIKDMKVHLRNNFMHSLADACFSTKDPYIIPSAGACSVCPNNTASNTLQFPEEENKGMCLDHACYKAKSDNHYEFELNRILEAEPDILIGYSSTLYGEELKQAKEMVRNGIPAVEIGYSTGWREISPPDYPDDKPDIADYDDPDEYLEDLKDFQGQVDVYNEELEEYNKQIASGKVRKVFLAAGNDKGKILFFENFRKETTAADAATVSGIMQIEELKAKDKRNEQLAFDKVYLACRDMILKSANKYTNDPSPITETEMIALLVVMISSTDSGLAKKIGYSYGDNKTKRGIALKLSEEERNMVTRSFIRHSISNHMQADFYVGESEALIQICRERFREEVAKVSEEQNKIVLRRRLSINQKIEALEQQLPEKLKVKKSKKKEVVPVTKETDQP